MTSSLKTIGGMITEQSVIMKLLFSFTCLNSSFRLHLVPVDFTFIISVYSCKVVVVVVGSEVFLVPII